MTSRQRSLAPALLLLSGGEQLHDGRPALRHPLLLSKPSYQHFNKSRGLQIQLSFYKTGISRLN